MSTLSTVATERAPFDLNRLGRRIDEERQHRDLTWSALTRDVGVATSTIRRFAVAVDAEADGVLALIEWLGLTPEEFVADSTVAGALLPPAGEGTIRVDMSLLMQLPTWPRRARAGTRTTIQRLVTTAQASQTTVASLTRWSAI